MCGIAGYIGKRKIESGRMEKCYGLMRHRGPDSTGFYQHAFGSDHYIFLLHSRLSIIDLNARANQPYQFGTKTLAVNGELYNYLEIKSELEAEGRSFVTTSDTEVLVQALDRWGVAALDRCEGMWAFACYDQEEGSLLLCRDRFGEKPLYLFSDNTGLYFGSEVKFIAALAGRSLPVNLRQVRRFLVNGYKSLYKSGETFFEGLKELPAGNFLKLSADGDCTLFAYWNPTLQTSNDMTYQEAVAGARDALVKSVQLRLRADVPLAFCMSGGVDSNSLISISKRLFGYDVHGFTIVNTDERYAEQDLVDQAVRDLGIRHTAIPVQTDNFLENLRALVRQHDAPVYTVSYYAHWLLMKSISEHGYRVSVSGTAADELFTGYYDHHGMYLYEVMEESGLFHESLENWKRHIAPIIRNPLLQDPMAFVKNPDQREHIYLEADEFASYLKGDFREEFNEVRYCEGLLRNRMLNELFQESVPVILHEDDLNAMCFSIENRSPFLDRGLFEFCYSIPTRFLIGNGYNKTVLRDAMRGIVPDPVLDSRRKVGFNAPIFSFLDHRNPDVRSVVLEDSPVFEFIRRDGIAELMSSDRLPNSESKFLFSFLAVKYFLEEFGT